ncbi:MAG: hypothetical protein GTO40_02720 [Deltaproteobacteria bacterium]|nr:hypothetical protein [Deltaproteobacteria bacterium]
MQTQFIRLLVLVLLLSTVDIALAQRGPGGRHMMDQEQMGSQRGMGPGMGIGGPTEGYPGPMGPGMMGYMGPHMMGPGMGGWGSMGPGMMGHMGPHMMGSGMMSMMGSGMGMMGSTEIMGAMISIRGEMMSLMGMMMQEHGTAMWQMTPEVRQQIQKEMMDGMGKILIKYGKLLQERAKTSDK